MIFRRPNLWISQSRAKFDEEADFEVRSALDPQKAHVFGEKRNFDPKFSPIIFFGVEKWNVGNRLKRVFAKFRGVKIKKYVRCPPT